VGGDESLDVSLPKRRRWRTGLLYGVLLASMIVFVLLPWLSSPIGRLDEAQLLVGGMLINQGQIPSRDFWATSTPLLYYLNAGAFVLLGPSAVSARLLMLVFYVLALGSWVGFLRTRDARFEPLLGAMSVALLFTLTIQAKWNAFALAFAALLLYASAIESEKPGSSWQRILSGLLTGFAILAKVNFGAYVAAAVGIETLCEAWRRRSWRFVIDNLAPFTVPLLVCFAAYLWINRGYLDAIFEQVLLFPATGLTASRMIILGESWAAGDRLMAVLLFIPIGTAVVLPLVWAALRVQECSLKSHFTIFDICLVLAVFLVVALAVAEFTAPRTLPFVALLVCISIILVQVAGAGLGRVEFLLVITYSFFLHYFLSRSDPWHYVPLVPLAIALLSTGFSLRLSAGGRSGIRVFLITVLIPPLVITSSFSWFMATAVRMRLDFPASVAAGLHVPALLESVLNVGDSRVALTWPLPLPAAEARLFPDQDEVVDATLRSRSQLPRRSRLRRSAKSRGGFGPQSPQLLASRSPNRSAQSPARAWFEHYGKNPTKDDSGPNGEGCQMGDLS
jgi:hypothetical protein